MNYRPATTLIHGETERTPYGETSEAVFLTSGFVYDDAEQAEATFAGEVTHYQYSRFGKPDRGRVRTPHGRAGRGGSLPRHRHRHGRRARRHAVPTYAGGDRVVASRALFGSCFWIVSTLLPRMGIAYEFVDANDMYGWRTALATPAQLVLLETPSNPMLEIVDIQAVADLAHAAGALVVVDNVFATPLLQRPLELGADVVVYSATKHIDGQGRVLGGAVLGRQKWIEETLQPYVRNTGPSLSPFNAWTLLKGMETLSLRVDAACARAAALADFLAAAPEISRVWYPARTDHPQHALAMRQMTAGGTLVTFELAGGKAAAFRFCNALRLISISNNLGDARSMVTHPATTTHMRIGAEERARLGITDGVVRLSVGLEDLADLQEDIAGALQSATLRQAAE